MIAIAAAIGTLWVAALGTVALAGSTRPDVERALASQEPIIGAADPVALQEAGTGREQHAAAPLAA